MLDVCQLGAPDQALPPRPKRFETASPHQSAHSEPGTAPGFPEKHGWGANRSTTCRKSITHAQRSVFRDTIGIPCPRWCCDADFCSCCKDSVRKHISFAFLLATPKMTARECFVVSPPHWTSFGYCTLAARIHQIYTPGISLRAQPQRRIVPVKQGANRMHPWLRL